MAIQKPTTKAPAEPVNSDQLEAREAATAPPQAAPGPSAGELEERTVEAENRAEAAERQVSTLQGEMAELKAQIALLMRAARTPQARSDAPAEQTSEELAALELDEDRPYGTVYGDSEVAYEQDGHQFGRDRHYVRTLKHRGAGRPFNPRLVGMTKPRPGQKAVDLLEGLRDQ